MRRFESVSDSDKQRIGAASIVRVVLGRVKSMISYVALYGVALSGYAGVGPWVIGIITLALAAFSYAEHSQLHARALDGGHIEASRSTIFHSLGNALVASGAAYAVGIIFRLI